MHVEVDEEDQIPRRGNELAGRRVHPPLRKRGHSKNRRGDAPQMVVGLAVTRDGLPVRSWVFPGQTTDVSTADKVKGDLRGWKLGRCVFVGDAGMNSEENRRTLSLGGGKDIQEAERQASHRRQVLADPRRGSFSLQMAVLGVTLGVAFSSDMTYALRSGRVARKLPATAASRRTARWRAAPAAGAARRSAPKASVTQAVARRVVCTVVFRKRRFYRSRRIGVTIPPEVLKRADRIVQ